MRGTQQIGLARLSCNQKANFCCVYLRYRDLGKPGNQAPFCYAFLYFAAVARVRHKTQDLDCVAGVETGRGCGGKRRGIGERG